MFVVVCNMLQSVWSFQPYSFDVNSLEYSTTSSVQERLSNYGLIFSLSEKDGNCFFTSVAKNICNNPDVWASKFREFGSGQVQFSNVYRKNVDKFLFPN